MINQFIDSIEDTFGKYKHGMRSAIEDKFSGLKDNDFLDLIKYLTEDYDMARPPSMKIILEECFRHNIPLNTKKVVYSISICEHCGQHFSNDALKCPRCNKLRKVGITKFVRYKPDWIEQEEKEELKDMFEWGDKN